MTEFSVLAVSPSDPDAPKKFAKSLRETGFAVIKDHDIDMTEINSMYDVWQPYFADDSKLKDATEIGLLWLQIRKCQRCHTKRFERILPRLSKK